MKKRISILLLALLLTLAPLSRAALAVSTPTLWMERGDGTARLTLRDLGDQPVSSVQLELTFSGSCPKASFSPSSTAADRYSFCRTEESGGRTTVTIYMDGIQSMNQNGSIDLGTLSLGGSYPAPGSAQLILLDRNQNPTSSVVPVQSSGSGNSSSGGSGNSSSGDSGSSGSSDNNSGDSGGSSGTDRRYTVQASGVGPGAVTVSASRARQGATVTVTVRPDDGCQLSELTAAAAGRTLSLRDIGGGRYTFTMPAANVEVTGTFAAPPAQESLPFTDVPEGIWFHDAVVYAYENGLMAGTGSDTFSPDLPTSRGMIVAILHRQAGSPEAGSSDFIDVAEDQYYAKAVAWAADNGVVSGYGDGRFGPDDPITREQMAVILQGYARLNGKDVSAQADLSGFSDAGDTSGYALNAIRWARAQGLINGVSPTTLVPGGTATRAQVAVLLKGFCQNVLYSG